MSPSQITAELFLHRLGILADICGSIALGAMKICLLSCLRVLLTAEPGRQRHILQCASVGKADFPWLGHYYAIDRTQMSRGDYIALTTRQEHDPGHGSRNVV